MGRAARRGDLGRRARFPTSTNFTPAEVHKTGLDQVAEISAQLDTLLKTQGMTKGPLAERLDAPNTRPDQLYADTAAGRAELIAGLNDGVARITARLPQAFLNPPTAPLEIRAVPIRAARRATSRARPPAVDRAGNRDAVRGLAQSW